MKLNIESIGGSDLAVSFKCECPSELFIGTEIEHLMKQNIRLYGYNDSNFFDTVNVKPREFKCKCGKRYTQQWFSDGFVEIEEIS